jgi:predicted RNA polymerase sigma factor
VADGARAAIEAVWRIEAPRVAGGADPVAFGVRADFLVKLSRLEEARAELLRAAALTRNERERALLEKRAAALGSQSRI